MVHECQGLALGIEAGDHLPGVHAGLEDLEGHLAADRLLLLGHKHQAEAPLADLFQQLVGTDDRPRVLGTGLVSCHVLPLGPAQESARIPICLQQFLDTLTQGRVGPACLVEKPPDLVGTLAFQGFEKDRLGIGLRVAHRQPPLKFRYSMPRLR